LVLAERRAGLIATRVFATGPGMNSDQRQVANSFPTSINAWNAAFIDAEYERYLADPNSVSPDLRAFFLGFELAGQRPTLGHASGDASGLRFQSAVDELIQSYRSMGHLAAKIDPFGRERPRPAALSIEFHGLTPADLDRTVDSTMTGISGTTTALRELIEHLDATYCGSIGVEFEHIQSSEERAWFLTKVEQSRGRIPLSPEKRQDILEKLARAEVFEKFLGKRYQGDKRFSLEGGESLIPLLDHLIEAASDLGVEEMVLGMAHRGRLNVLNNIMGKSYQQIFTEFEDNWEEGFVDGGGDVKYHRGHSGLRKFSNGKGVYLAMASNPSHLESVNPVVEGRCRAKQRIRRDTERRRVVPLLIHGDAAIAGQGMIAECLNFSQLEGYTTGGTIHIVTNNLIGFTTVPEDARSTTYCTDIAKAIDAPVFHVNGEDPEACIAVAQWTIEYRQRFRKDVMIDVVCYRKYGHNEQDEQSYTNPVLAALVREKLKKNCLAAYTERLIAEGVITADHAPSVAKRLDDALDAAQTAAKKTPLEPTIDAGSARWAGMQHDYSHEPAKTAISREVIAEVAATSARVPAGFNVNPKLAKLLEQRATILQGGLVNYADGEQLAFGSLLLEGVHVRLSGQDCRRGTFSHRHAVLRDLEVGTPFTPLNSMREVAMFPVTQKGTEIGRDGRPMQAELSVYDSPLSEQSVMGFDYGYSLADPHVLVCWEGQFGDFVNGAQVIIDQYLTSAEIKWDRWSGLVLLLPHGYEGAGPEHSSARLERFLQACGQDNIQVINPTNGSQIFHALRRQVHRNFRKPLIVMTPKSMLRDMKAASPVGDLMTGTFKEVLDDPAFLDPSAKKNARAGVKRLVLCSGKIFYELSERRIELGRSDIAIVRIEQMYPMQHEMLADVFSKYPKGVEVVWAQEEPRNMGAYTFVADQLRTTHGIEMVYIGRDTAASPAVGSKHVHKDQQEAIITAVVGPSPKADKAKAAKPVRTVVNSSNGNGASHASAKKAAKAGPNATSKPISSKR
jgi:2-oxoglutarate dehydrogenase E1 component